MKLYITGGNGQLAAQLKNILLTGSSQLGPLPIKIQPENLVLVDIDQLDITQTEAVISHVQREKPDVIINCAAYTNVDGCEENQDAAFAVNALGARNMAVAAESAGAKLIHISTDYVFAGDGHTPYSEWDICHPQSIYGYSKLLGEQYVRDFCSRYFIVRTAWLYGEHGSNFVKTILKAAKEKGKLTVVRDQVGNPTYAEDLAHHLVRLALTDEYGIYHCTGNGICSWYDFACEIVRLADIPCEVTPCATLEYPRPAKRPTYSALENRMLRITVGDHMRSWQEALASFISINK